MTSSTVILCHLDSYSRSRIFRIWIVATSILLSLSFGVRVPLPNFTTGLTSVLYSFKCVRIIFCNNVSYNDGKIPGRCWPFRTEGCGMRWSRNKHWNSGACCLLEPAAGWCNMCGNWRRLLGFSGLLAWWVGRWLSFWNCRQRVFWPASLPTWKLQRDASAVPWLFSGIWATRKHTTEN